MEKSGVGLACVNCGYSLEGLGPDGRCPECGSPVEYSMAFWERPEAARYLRQIRRGARIAIAAIVMFASHPLIWMIVPHAPVSRIPTLAFSVAATATMGCWVAGWWMICRPSPKGARIEREWVAAGARPLLFVLALFIPGVIAAAAIELAASPMEDPVTTALLSGAAVCSFPVLLPAIWALGFLRLGSIAHAILMRADLARRCRWAVYGLLVLLPAGLGVRAWDSLLPVFVCMVGLGGYGAAVLWQVGRSADVMTRRAAPVRGAAGA